MLSRRRCTLLLLIALVALPIGVSAQTEPARTEAGNGHGRAFAVEAVGGALGSATGFWGAGLVTGGDDCNVEDLSCLLDDLALRLLGATVGAAVGVYTAGTLADTRPSGWGAALGSVAGAAAGIGAVHLLSEELGIVHNDGLLRVSYVLTQGIVSAAGSRLVAALRR